MSVVNAESNQADIMVRRFSTSDIPKDDEGMANWLIKLYQSKVSKMVVMTIIITNKYLTRHTVV